MVIQLLLINLYCHRYVLCPWRSFASSIILFLPYNSALRQLTQSGGWFNRHKDFRASFRSNIWECFSVISSSSYINICIFQFGISGQFLGQTFGPIVMSIEQGPILPMSQGIHCALGPRSSFHDLIVYGQAENIYISLGPKIKPDRPYKPRCIPDILGESSMGSKDQTWCLCPPLLKLMFLQKF